MLALQRDAHILQRRQMRKYRRDLERANQAEPRHVGRRHRRDVLPLVEDLARRRLQKLGQEIEAGRLAGPVRADQRVNAAAADLERDVANGKETREFLGQSVGFENELIGQSNFPHQPSPRRPVARGRFFPYAAGSSRTSWKSVPDLPPPGRNMPSTARVRQGGKLGMRRGPGPTAPLVELRQSGRSGRFADGFRLHGCRKAVVNGILPQSRRFHQIFSPWADDSRVFIGIGLQPWNFESAKPSVVKSIKQRDLLNTWLRLYARDAARCRAWRNISPRGSRKNFPTWSTMTVDTHAAAAAPDDRERRHADVDRLWPYRQGPLSRRISRRHGSRRS